MEQTPEKPKPPVGAVFVLKNAETGETERVVEVGPKPSTADRAPEGSLWMWQRVRKAGS
jgi:hypothetical protein